MRITLTYTKTFTQTASELLVPIKALETNEAAAASGWLHSFNGWKLKKAVLRTRGTYGAAAAIAPYMDSDNSGTDIAITEGGAAISHTAAADSQLISEGYGPFDDSAYLVVKNSGGDGSTSIVAKVFAEYEGGPIAAR